MLESNAHVARLRRFQPFHADSAELIFEHSSPNEDRFELRGLEALRAAVESSAVRMVVLTGDAGHGKTSLCADLLESLGLGKSDAARAIRESGDASSPVALTKGGRDLFLLKDLSDLTVLQGGQLLASLRALDEGSVAVVCANEGRLRNAVSSIGEPRVVDIVRTLEAGLEDGSTSSVDPSLCVLNLNYQSVVPETGSGLLDWALKTWAVDRRRWRSCERCDARNACPILANHLSLSDSTAGRGRRDSFMAIFAAAERAGAVVTTRQALALVAYALTGGLACTDVHGRWQRSSRDRSWQFRYLYHEVLFGDLLTSVQRHQVPTIQMLRRLDPGRVSQREVDDYLDVIPESEPFLPPLPRLDEGAPSTRKAARREESTVGDLMAFLRRRSYFDDSTSTDRMARLGFTSGQDFQQAAEHGEDHETTIRDQLLRGLEAVQGVHRSGEPADFYILDPAFLSQRSGAALVAARIQSRNALVLSHRSRWVASEGENPELALALDWLSRETFLRIRSVDKTVTIPIDLLRFELLHRWARGLRSRSQHEAETRSLSGFLAHLVPDAEEADEITVLVGGDRRSLSIDIGERVRSGGA